MDVGGEEGVREVCVCVCGGGGGVGVECVCVGRGRVGVCVRGQSESGYWSAIVSVFLISEHSICTADDSSRMGGMPFSFMCACAKFVITGLPILQHKKDMTNVMVRM